MESSTLEKIKGEINNTSLYNNNKNNFYGPPIIYETKNEFFKRKMKREFIYCKVKNKIFSFKFIFNSPAEL